MSKKTLLILFILSTSFSAMAQFHVGGFMGYNRSKYTGDTPPSEIYGWSGGFLFGVSSKYSFSEAVSITIDANFAENNAFYQIYDDNVEGVKIDSAELKLVSVGVPIGIIVRGMNNRFFVKSAFEFQFPITAKAIRVDSEQDFSHQVKDLCFAIQFGAGYIIPIGKPNLIFELNYTQGISNLSTDKFNEEPEYSIARTKLQGVRFKVGFEYPLGNKQIKKAK